MFNNINELENEIYGKTIYMLMIEDYRIREAKEYIKNNIYEDDLPF